MKLLSRPASERASCERTAHNWRTISTWMLLLIITCSLSAHLLLWTSAPHAIYWDSAVYMGMGKYIANGEGLWEDNRPVGLPLVYSLFHRAGIDLILVGEFISIVSIVAVLALTYLIATHLFGYRTAVLSTLLLSTTGIFFAWSHHFLSGTPSTALSLFAVYAALRSRWFVSGLVASLAFITRYPAGIIYLGIAYLLMCAETGYRKYIRVAFGVVLGALPLLYHGRDVIADILLAGAHQSNAIYGVEGVLQNVFHYLLILPKISILFLLVGVVLLLWQRKWTILVLLAPYLLYFTSIVNKQPRFAMLFLPYYALIIAYAATTVARWRIGQLALIFLIVLSTMHGITMVKYHPFGERTHQEQLAAFVPSEPTITTTPIPAAFINTRLLPAYDTPAATIETLARPNAQYLIHDKQYYPPVTDVLARELREVDRTISGYTLLYTQGQYSIWRIT